MWFSGIVRPASWCAGCAQWQPTLIRLFCTINNVVRVRVDTHLAKFVYRKILSSPKAKPMAFTVHGWAQVCESHCRLKHEGFSRHRFIWRAPSRWFACVDVLWSFMYKTSWLMIHNNIYELVPSPSDLATWTQCHRIMRYEPGPWKLNKLPYLLRCLSQSCKKLFLRKTSSEICANQSPFH